MLKKSQVHTHNTRPGSLSQSGLLQIGSILLAIMASLMLGLSDIIYSIPYPTPVIITGIFTITIAAVVWVRKPIWALYTALFVIFLPPDLIPPDTHSILNRSITVAALIVGLFDIAAHRRRIEWTGAAALMLAFLIWGAITLLWAENMSPATTILQAYALRLILFLFLIPAEIRTRENLDGLMQTLALNGWVLIAASIWTVLIQGYTPGTRLRVLGTNENALGILALVTLIGVLWQTVQPSPQRKRLHTLAAWVFLLGAIALVAISGSRGSAISLMVMLLVFCLWKPTRRWGVMGFLILAMGIAVAPLLFATTLQRFAVVRGDTPLGGRESLWQAAWRLILDHPWGGVGIGNAPYAVMDYLRPLRSTMGMEKSAIHNPVLTIWAETGVLGILLYLGVLVSALWMFVRKYLQNCRADTCPLIPYFALVSSLSLGYMASWIKGGSMESDHTYFLILALLLIPSCLDTKQEVGR